MQPIFLNQIEAEIETGMRPRQCSLYNQCPSALTSFLNFPGGTPEGINKVVCLSLSYRLSQKPTAHTNLHKKYKIKSPDKEHKHL